VPARFQLLHYDDVAAELVTAWRVEPWTVVV
jgi:hypothetical protein